VIKANEPQKAVRFIPKTVRFKAKTVWFKYNLDRVLWVSDTGVSAIFQLLEDLREDRAVVRKGARAISHAY